ncbi:MAG: FprA family A-type flavoprotein [Erysipelotrichia bacterium]|nr:FprA family A-type flavoprotein [Erysipelotrichia bacterium]
MKTLEIKKQFYWIGAQDPDLRVFDIIMETKYGTSYNSYLLKTEEGIILFESVKEKFFDEYIKQINHIGSIDEVKYIVCNHTEPDHSGSIAKLLAMNPNIIVVSSMLANMYLKEIINHDFKAMIVKDGEELKLANKTLRFISTPNLHWPDTMYTYIVEDEILVTCDSFGAHYAHEDILLSLVKKRSDYEDGFNYYSTMIMEPFKEFVLKAMKKIENLAISFIATGHGPVIDCVIQAMIEKYIAFSQPNQKEDLSVVISYVSAYGYTKQMAQVIQEVFTTEKINCQIYDLVAVDHEQVIQEMMKADGILYGCPTLLNDALPPIYHVMNSVLPAYHGKKTVSAFGSYGWSGEAVPNMIARLKQQKMNVVDEGLKIKFKPSDAQLEEIKAYALHFAKALKENHK